MMYKGEYVIVFLRILSFYPTLAKHQEHIATYTIVVGQTLNHQPKWLWNPDSVLDGKP